MDSNISTQGHDVTVGEVDIVNIPDSPKTGMFGLEGKSVALAGAVILPIIVILLFLSKRIRRKQNQL